MRRANNADARRDGGVIVIRSYRRCFEIDRRIYALGDWQLPAPNGIPLRGFGYAVAVLLLTLIVWRLPVLGAVFGIFPWPFRHVLLPVWVAMIGMTFSPDGRRADLFVWTWLCLLARRVRTRVRRESMDLSGKLRVRWDASGTELHRAQIKGPARVIFDVPVELNDRWEGWRAEGGQGEPQTVAVRADQTLRVRP